METRHWEQMFLNLFLDGGRELYLADRDRLVEVVRLVLVDFAGYLDALPSEYRNTILREFVWNARNEKR